MSYPICFRFGFSLFVECWLLLSLVYCFLFFIYCCWVSSPLWRSAIFSGDIHRFLFSDKGKKASTPHKWSMNTIERLSIDKYKNEDRQEQQQKNERESIFQRNWIKLGSRSVVISLFLKFYSIFRIHCTRIAEQWALGTHTYDDNNNGINVILSPLLRRNAVFRENGQETQIFQIVCSAAAIASWVDVDPQSTRRMQ